MIELHSHVLPGLDDGAANMDESLQMLADYAAQGVTTVVCTPHIYAETFIKPDALSIFLMLRDDRLNRLQMAANARNLGVTLLPGAEIMLTTAMLPIIRQPITANQLTINGGSYLLVELPSIVSGGLRSLEGLLFEIQLAGLQPILAHPERTAHNEGVMPVLKSWVESGRVLLQANAGHLVDDPRLDVERQARYRRRKGIVLEMIKGQMIQFIASDAHNPISRPCQHREVFGVVSSLYGQQTANRLLIGNPGCVIADQEVQAHV